MFKVIAIVIVVLIAAVLVVAAMQPDIFRIERSTTVKASPDEIFPYLNDFEKAMAWSPYEKKDPAMKRKFTNGTAGKGAIYEFEGNSEVGSGRIEILESLSNEKVTLQLDMYKPMKGSNIVEYILSPKDGATEVTWAMHGQAPFLSKVICLFLNMDKMVGKDFEQGLATLKSLAESQPDTASVY